MRLAAIDETGPGRQSRHFQQMPIWCNLRPEHYKSTPDFALQCYFFAEICDSFQLIVIAVLKSAPDTAGSQTPFFTVIDCLQLSYCRRRRNSQFQYLAKIPDNLLLSCQLSTAGDRSDPFVSAPGNTPPGQSSPRLSDIPPHRGR